jgi:putative serine protease PepD
MPMKKSVFRNPFISALFGGALVAIVGLIAISAGWVKSDSGSTTTTVAPLTAPVVSKSSNESTNAVNQIYKADGNGVAFIESQIPAPESSALSPFGEPESSGGGTATGSGIVIDGEGHVLTNNHVIAGANKIEVKLGASNTEYTAEVVGTDPASDLALLKVEAPSSELHPLTLGDSSKAEVGDPVVAIGNPFGLDRTVTSGIVSALQRQIQAPNGFSIDNVIQTDAAINPGNSGGPLLDDAAHVVGVNAQIATASGVSGNVGVGFAIPSNTVRQVVPELKKGQAIARAWLGLSSQPVSGGFGSGGAQVGDVTANGPAEQAGIQPGDVITKIDGKTIHNPDDVSAVVTTHRPGDVIPVTVVRGGSVTILHAKLGTRPGNTP